MNAPQKICDSQSTLFERDYYLWLTHTVQLLREKILIEEIESLGRFLDLIFLDLKGLNPN